MSVPTTSQTVGPFFSIGLGYRNPVLDDVEDRPESVILITGTIFDASGIPVPDAQLELWRADVSGEYSAVVSPSPMAAAENYDGFTRVATNENGVFAFATVLPGMVSGPKGTMQAPHIVVAIFMRGLLSQLYTRIYFAGQDANAADPVLDQVPEERRSTLVAQPQENSPNCYRWDVYLQGSQETVFFAY